MSDDRIERDTLIAAPLERVWSLVTEPGFWVGGPAAGTVARVDELVIAKNEQVFDAFTLRAEQQ